MSEQPMNGFVSKDTFDGRAKVVDERFARDKEQLDEHKTSIKVLSDLTITMTEMIKRHDSQVNDHEKRLDQLEKAPVETWSKMKMTFITGIVGIVAAAVGGGLIYLLTMVK